ncbi:hypothetical protein AHF37_11162 [Paragonimus kellicotti]|nr:hypothetical protein AHF37_11162 [Paragonimus kellicotti]
MNFERRSVRRNTSQPDSELNNEDSARTYASVLTLARDMSKLVNRKLFSDVHFFVGNDREKIFGHKCVLAARSEVFSQLFLSEPNKVSFEMCTVKPVSFLLLFYFLYTNSISFDRLDIYEVFDLMKTAKEYRCFELQTLTELNISSLLDTKTVFEFLPTAFQLNFDVLRRSAIEYIEDFSSSLLTPNNENILFLTPVAMRAILDSDLLEVEELRLVEVACYWADNYLQRAKEHCANLERGQARTSIINIRTQPDDTSTQGSTDMTLIDFPVDHTDASHSHLPLMQKAHEDVVMVMHGLRLALLQPNELARLEEEHVEKRLIPVSEESFMRRMN